MNKENEDGFILKRHKPLNPFTGKTFKLITYNQVDQAINTEELEITSQEELRTILDNLKQYNDEHAHLEGYLKRYKKLIIE